MRNLVETITENSFKKLYAGLAALRYRSLRFESRPDFDELQRYKENGEVLRTLVHSQWGITALHKNTKKYTTKYIFLFLQRFPGEKLYKSGGTGIVYVTHILLNSVGF